MTLADDLASVPEVEAELCRFGRALAAFPDDADAIMGLARPGPGVTKRRAHLIAVLKRHGHSMGNSSIDRHLAGSCACFG